MKIQALMFILGNSFLCASDALIDLKKISIIGGTALVGGTAIAAGYKYSQLSSENKNKIKKSITRGAITCAKQAMVGYALAEGRVAAHEAGHALAGRIATGCPFDVRIGILPDEKLPSSPLVKIGGFSIYGLSIMSGGSYCSTPRTTPMRQIAVSAAGPLAGFGFTYAAYKLWKLKEKMLQTRDKVNAEPRTSRGELNGLCHIGKIILPLSFLSSMAISEVAGLIPDQSRSSDGAILYDNLKKLL